MSLKNTQINLVLPLTLIIAYASNMLLELVGLDTSSGVIYHLILIAYLTLSTFSITKSLTLRIVIPFIMTSYMMGDFVMGGVIPLFPRLIIGMAIFALGHAIAGLLVVTNKSFKGFIIDTKKTLITTAVIIALWGVMVFNSSQLVMSLSALVYALILGINISIAWSASAKNIGAKYLIIGFSFYTLSDLVIAMKSIKGVQIPDPWYGYTVWFTYVIAISLVSFGLLQSLNSANRQSS